MRIRYIPYEEIDRQLYDSCIHYALNGRAYAYKWYLEATARRFDVLVENEYESVMPLVWDTTWSGRKRLINPAFTQSLGVFSVHVLSQKRMGFFLREVDARFDVVESNFTGEPSRYEEDLSWNWKDARNVLLDVDTRQYDDIAAQYDSTLLRSLQKSDDANLLVHGNSKPEKLAEFMVKHYPKGTFMQHAVRRILYNALHRGYGWTTSVTDQAGEVLAMNAFVFTHGRIYSIAQTQSSKGEEVGALDLLFDYAIRQASGRQVILDFMSTDAEQYLRFGASQERFWQAHKSTKLLGVLPI